MAIVNAAPLDVNSQAQLGQTRPTDSKVESTPKTQVVSLPVKVSQLMEVACTLFFEAENTKEVLEGLS